MLIFSPHGALFFKLSSKMLQRDKFYSPIDRCQCFRPSRSTPNSSENDHFPVFLLWIVAEGPVQAGFLIYPSCTPYCVLSMGILVISGPSLWIVCVYALSMYVCVCMCMYYFKTGVWGGECMKAKSVKKYICPADVNLLDRSP